MLPDVSAGHQSRYFSQTAVTVRGEYSVVFASPGTSFMSITRFVVQV